MANNIDPDEMAHYEPSHLDLHCLQRYLHLLFFCAERETILLCRKLIPMYLHCFKIRSTLEGKNFHPLKRFFSPLNPFFPEFLK